MRHRLQLISHRRFHHQFYFHFEIFANVHLELELKTFRIKMKFNALRLIRIL